MSATHQAGQVVRTYDGSPLFWTEMRIGIRRQIMVVWVMVLILLSSRFLRAAVIEIGMLVNNLGGRHDFCNHQKRIPIRRYHDGNSKHTTHHDAQRRVGGGQFKGKVPCAVTFFTWTPLIRGSVPQAQWQVLVIIIALSIFFAHAYIPCYARCTGTLFVLEQRSTRYRQSVWG